MKSRRITLTLLAAVCLAPSEPFAQEQAAPSIAPATTTAEVTEVTSELDEVIVQSTPTPVVINDRVPTPVRT